MIWITIAWKLIEETKIRVELFARRGNGFSIEFNIDNWNISHIKRAYRKTSNISRTFVGNKIVDNSDVVGASPVGAAPITSSFST